MKKIKGFSIPFDIKGLKWKVDLIEYNGPLLSLYYNKKGDYYLFYWTDSDDECNKWMILRVDLNTLRKYIDGEITLRQVILEPADNFVWFIDLDSNMNVKNTLCVSMEDIPQGYLPSTDSYFDFEKNKDILEAVNTDTYELDIPVSDRSKFSEIISKMGWKISARIHNGISKTAVF